jgi:enamine deaminase RidA (YjgF/YER057c/UK114 family)
MTTARKRREKIQPESLYVTEWGGHTLYSHVVAAEGRRMIFVSGQVPFDRDGSIVGKGDMRAQLRQVGENLKAALAAAGVTLEDLVKTTTYTTDIREFFRHADLRAEYLGPALPTSTTVEVRRLARRDFLVEIEAIAMTD